MAAGRGGGADDERGSTIYSGEDEGTTTSTAAKLRVAAVTASATVATPAVAFAPEKPKVGAAPNMGAGSPVSLAAILRKAGSQKKQAHK